MKAYHGSPRAFKAFDRARIGEGEGASLLAAGFYLATHPAVAETYRQRLAVEGSEFSDVIYFLDGEPLSPEISRRIHELKRVCREEVPGSSAYRMARMELELTRHDDTLPQVGVVHEVAVPERESLMVWEGNRNEQPFDLPDLLRELYGQDEVEVVYDEAMEECPLGVSGEHFDRVFDRALMQGVHTTREELDEIAPGFDWSRLEAVMGKHCPMIMDDEEEEVGRALYGALAHSMGGEREAAEWLSARGIKGCITHQEFTGFQGPCELLVVWSEEDATVTRWLGAEAVGALSADLEAPVGRAGGWNGRRAARGAPGY